jgi:hypothetical protein
VKIRDKAEDLLKLLSPHRGEFVFIEQKIEKAYLMYIPFILQSGDIKRIADAMQEIIDLGVKFSEHPEVLKYSIENALPILLQSGQQETALKISVKFTQSLKESNRKDEYYIFGLKMTANLLKMMNRFQEFINLLPEMRQTIIDNSGEKSVEFVDYKLNEIEALLMMKNKVETYKIALETFDLAKAVYGSEDNEKAPLILQMMAILKFNNLQFEDAMNLIKKIKKSAFYTHDISEGIKQIEEMIQAKLDAKDAHNKDNPKAKKDSILKKMSPNTPIKFGIYLSIISAVTIGTLYYLKKK